MKIENISDQTNLIIDNEKHSQSHWYEDLLFLKIYPLMRVAQHTQLSQDDFGDNFQLPQAELCYEEYMKFRENQQSNKLDRILLKFFGKRLLKIYFLQLIQLGCQLMMAIIIKLVLEYISNQNKGLEQGWYLLCIILMIKLGSLFSESHSKLMIKQIGYDAMSIMSMNIMSKCLKISLLSNNQRTIGEITNLLQVDAQQLNNVTNNLTNVAIIPILLSLSLWYMYREVGITVFVGIIIIMITLLINHYFGKYLLKSQKLVLKSKDARIKQTNEIFQQIKFIKINSLEKIFQEKIEILRKEEMKNINKRFNFFAWNIFIGWLSPQLIQSLSFGLYVYLGNTLTPGIVFPMISLLIMLAISLQNLPVSINQVLDTMLSLKRIQGFLETDEQMLNCIQWYEFQDPKLSVQIEKGDFFWNAQQQKTVQQNTLKNININIQPQKFISIIGDIGSGKSSIIQSLLGEMLYNNKNNQQPSVIIQGNIAYVGQKAWIQNATVKDNILFGKQYHKESYDKAVFYSCLSKDMDILINKDETMIGEKGVNLSGGQKARISLARAIYSDADIYLLDDPLSAVDIHVANFIMQECFVNYLKDKTRILCTHMLNYCKFTDYIYFLQNGEIISQGDYQSIVQIEKFQDIQKKFSEPHEDDDVIDDQIIVNTADTMSQQIITKQVDFQNKTKQENLMLKEDQQEGEIEFSVFKQYFQYNDGCRSFVFLIIIMGLQIFSQIISTIWLAQWSTVEPVQKQHNDKIYWSVYFVLGIFQAIFAFGRVLVINNSSLKSSTEIHNNIIDSLLKAPLCNFFERVPVGRIMNRLTKDINSLDIEISMNIRVFSMKLGQVISSTIIAIITSTKLLIFPCILFFYISLTIQRIYMKASRELQRLELISKSPILSYFVESLQGLPVIRAFKKQNLFMNNFGTKLDKNRQIVYVQTVANCWFSQFLGLSSLIVNMTAISYCVFFSSNAAFAGLIFTYVSSLDVSIQQTIDSLSLLENNMISFERCLEFTQIPQENQEENREKIKSWPTNGIIKFNQLSVKYRVNLPCALDNFSYLINSNEKIGIVGRTGAGKSTIALSLLRILEAYEGQILIDDVDISSIPLKQLREAITTILQDSTIFHGSVRQNLDPQSLCLDQEIIQVINDCCLNKLLGNRNGLDTLVDEGGDNLSAGEKQLICIARAILKKNKIIIIDEATANIDVETEKKIQETIEKAFKYCTVITIAHRISTILRCDKIIVIDNGQIVESGNTQELLKDNKSLFYQVYQQVRNSHTQN